jgi:L-fucose isomerase-like protein
MCDGCTRRQFLGSSAGALGAGLFAAKYLRAGADTETGSVEPMPKVRICAILTGQPLTGRNWSFCEEDVPVIHQQLSEIEKKLGNIEFVVGQANNAAQAAPLLEQAGPEAPVLAINVGMWALQSVMEPVREQNRAAAVFASPGTGHEWMYPFRWQRRGAHVTLMPSSDLGELERAARLLRVAPMMKRSRVLVVLPAKGTAASCDPDLVKEKWGVDVAVLPAERFDEVFETVDDAAAEAEAQRWIDEARQVVEPSRDDVLRAARASLALDQIIEETQARAIAVGGCMGWLKRGFPCLGFTRLRDRGIPAVCEGDMDSLWTMLLFQYAFDLPGFQGNNYFDTAKNACWTAHCTGALKMDGVDGPAAPYQLRGHSEIGNDGAVPEVLYRIGQPITRAKLVNLEHLLVSTGEIIEVPEKSFRACRTQLCSRVKDAERMVFNWGGGVLEHTEDAMTLLHRVVYYGDHLNSLRHLGRLMDFQVIEEG